MKSRSVTAVAALALALAWGVPAAQAQVTTNYVAGNFTYQFADPITGQPITTLTIPQGSTAKVAVYLLQTGGNVSNLIQTLGAEGLGVRLNYANPAGIVRVPDSTNVNITQRPPPTNNINGVSSDYSLVQRYGSGITSNTITSAAISDGLISLADPLPFPGDGNEDPLNNMQRMLIGTFTLAGLAPGTEPVTAVSGPSSGTNSLSGQNPTVIGTRNDGTTGPLPGNGSQGEVRIDQFLAQNAASPTIPTLSVTVTPVPEPGTLALCALASSGFVAWRRRRRAAAAAA
jgi:hypothetical protein